MSPHVTSTSAYITPILLDDMTAPVETSPVTADQLLERVKEIRPTLSENASEAERERRLPLASFEAMREAGLYQMWLPRTLGGHELDPVSGTKILEEVSAIDSAAGWNLQIACAVTILMAYLPEEGGKEVAGSPYGAGGFFPPGRAEEVEGGYRLTSRAPFSSGCHQASWFVSQAQVYDGDKPRFHDDGAPVMIWPFYRADEGRVVDTWRTMGMRGTGSHDTVADGVFVPHERAAQPRPLTNPAPDFRGPLYRMTVWVPVAVLAAPALGIARAALELVLDLGNKKRPNYLSQTMGERSVTQSQVAEAAAMIDAARSHLHNSLAAAFESVQGGDLISQDHKIRIQLATTFAVRTAADAVDLLGRAAGTTSIKESSLLEKHFRDVQVITRHAYSSTARYESVGKLLFGHESDWGFFAL